MTPFDFVNSISFNKTDLFTDPQADKDYIPFVINRQLSYFPDTIMYANQINQHPLIDKRWQFTFYLHALSKRKRFSKWAKKPAISDDAIAVANYYKYSLAKAVDTLSLLTDDQLQLIKQHMDKGGTG